VLLYKSPFATTYLTTAHPASSYGQPVLLVSGEAHGPADVLPSGITAGDLVRLFLDGSSPGGGSWARRTKELVRLAEHFLATAP